MSKVVSLDLEMNPTSSFKIIQIGYVIGDVVSQRIFEKKSLIIDPKEVLGYATTKNGQVHISDFTGITQERINSEGMPLTKGYQILCDDIKKHNPTVTVVQWGDGAKDNKGDHDHMRRELGLSWDEFVFRPRSWDVKSLFQIYRVFNRQGVDSGVEAALKALGMNFEGRPHDALDDAYNTFKIFCVLGQKMTLADKIQKIAKF